MRRFFLFLIISGLLILVFSCARENPLPGGYQKIIGNNEGAILDTVLVQQDRTEDWFTETVNTSYSSELLVGSYEQYRAGTYFVFTNLPDTVTIHSAELKLNIKNRLTQNDTSFWHTPHEATIKFYLADTTWDKDNAPIPDESLLLSSYIYNSDSVNQITIPLDSAQINAWSAETSPIQHYGIWMQSPDAEFMISLHAHETLDVSTMPRMTMIFTIPDTSGGVRDTVTYYASRDGFILLNKKENLILNSEKLYIGKGIAFRNYLKFDLAGFDTTVHVNRAVLELTANAGNSIRDLFGVEDCIIYRLGEPWIVGNINNDSLKASYGATVSDSILTFDVTPSLQGWISKNYENFGFLMESTYEYESIGRVAFYSSLADFELRPKIRLYYTLPPQQQF